MAGKQQALKVTARIELSGASTGLCGGALHQALTSATVQVDIDFPVPLDDMAGMVKGTERVTALRERLGKLGRVVFWRVRTGALTAANRAPDEAIEEGEPGNDVTGQTGKAAA